MRRRVGGRGGDAKATPKSTIGMSGHRSWRGWPHAVGRGQVHRAPPIRKGVVTFHRSVEQGYDPPQQGVLGPMREQGEAT
jgi:hypothetical protein